MIQWIELTNFKAHRATRVELEPLTVLVGPNGAGKSSFIRAASMLARLARHEVPEEFVAASHFNSVLSKGVTDGTVAVRAGGTIGADSWEVSVSSNQPAGSDPVPRVEWSWANLVHKLPSADGGFATPGEFVLSPVGALLSRISLFAFDPALIGAPTMLNSTEPQVGPHGEYVAAVLAAIDLKDRALFDEIGATIRRIVPIIERVRVVPAGTGGGIGFRVDFDFRGAPGVPAEFASSGTLVTLALVTALHGPNAPRVVLIDEIDHSLHPRAQLELVRQLRRLVEARPELQIIATTHSPYILDEFRVEEVRVFALRPDGSVAVKPLGAHPDATSTAGKLSAGQLWSLDDEQSWVAGGQPWPPNG